MYFANWLRIRMTGMADNFVFAGPCLRSLTPDNSVCAFQDFRADCVHFEWPFCFHTGDDEKKMCRADSLHCEASDNTERKQAAAYSSITSSPLPSKAYYMSSGCLSSEEDWSINWSIQPANDFFDIVKGQDCSSDACSLTGGCDQPYNLSIETAWSAWTQLRGLL